MTRKIISGNYNHTIYASCIGFITQAIINNFIPLLFLTFQTKFGLSLDKIGFLITINFGVQLLTDMLAARYADRIGYRRSVAAAHVFCVIGLAGLAVFPDVLSVSYMGIILAVICYAIGGGMIEVLISPIVEACPTEKKEAAMSLLHSFYCWGHVFVVLVSTAFFLVFGIENWRILACLWAVIPLMNVFYFLKVPIAELVKEDERLPVFDLMKSRMFWLFIVLMLCAGASEQAMSQWASAFAESSLGASKVIGDLAGPTLFAALMGCARLFYAKFSHTISIEKFMSISSLLCLACYLLASLSQNKLVGFIGVAATGISVGILWPGTLSLASKGIPKGGTALFAFLALAGDLGCSVGPTFVGVVSEAFNENLKKGILFAAIFPIGLLIILGAYKIRKMTIPGQNRS